MGITDEAHRLLSGRRATLWIMFVMEGIFVAGYLTAKHHNWFSWYMLTIPPMLLAMGLGSQFGKPKNWWAAYLGTVMDVNLNRFEAEYSTRGHVLRQEVTDWLKSCGIKHYYQQNAYRYVFLHKKHAVMFKMAWG